MSEQVMDGHPFRQLQERNNTLAGAVPHHAPHQATKVGEWLNHPDPKGRNKRKCRPGMGWRRPASETGISYVYAIQCGGFIKIGVSDTPEDRMRDLQAANPHPLTIAGRWAVARHVREDVERFAHELLRMRRVRNEWFQATFAEATRAVERAMEVRAALRSNPTLRQSIARPLDLLDSEFALPSTTEGA